MKTTTNERAGTPDECDPRHLGERDRNALDDLEALVSKRLQYIRLTQEFAEIANRADSVEEGIWGAIECFCRGLGWPLGHAILEVDANSGTLVDSNIWWMEQGLECGSFVDASAAMTYEAGDDFVGRVVVSAEAQWIGEDSLESIGQRSHAAREVGLKCGIAFPLLIQSRVAGVLEFYSHDVRQCERELLDAVAHLGTQLGRVIEREEFERELAQMTQEERRRLGRSLHDTLSQQLTGVGMLARSLERKLHDQGNVEADRARDLRENIQEAREQLRAVAHGLNPVDIDAGTLSRSIADFAEETATAFDVRCALDERVALVAADDFTANQIFFIVREAVHNAAKYADAKLIAIEVIEDPAGSIELRIRDDGRGFDVKAVERSGMGLRTLRYRCRLIGAKLRIESSPGSGTSIICALKKGGGER